MTSSDFASQRRLGRLMMDYEEYRRNVADYASEAALATALNALHGKRSRLAAVERDIERLQEEARWIAEEIRGREAGLELILLDAIGRIEPGMWSPAPVLGYRIWEFSALGLRGVRVTWRSRSLTAHCEGDPRDRVPHSDGRCGRLGCGVYATKELAPLLGSYLLNGDGYLVGVTALTGKVVEHEAGYRAEHAELVAAYAVSEGKYLATDDVEVIDQFFGDPAHLVKRHGEPIPRHMFVDLRKYLVGYLEERRSLL